MPISIDEYRRLKKRADLLKDEASRAEGALNQLMQKLQEIYDCESLEEAKQLLTKKTKELNEAEQKYEQELAKFKEKWGDQL